MTYNINRSLRLLISLKQIDDVTGYVCAYYPVTSMSDAATLLSDLRMELACLLKSDIFTINQMVNFGLKGIGGKVYLVMKFIDLAAEVEFINSYSSRTI